MTWAAGLASTRCRRITTGLPAARPTSAGSPAGETEEERFARYRKDAQEIYDLAGEISVAGIGKRDVRVFETTAELVNAAGLEVPVVSRA